MIYFSRSKLSKLDLAEDETPSNAYFLLLLSALSCKNPGADERCLLIISYRGLENVLPLEDSDVLSNIGQFKFGVGQTF